MTETSTLKPIIEACRTDITGQFRGVYEHMIDKVFGYVRFRVNTEEEATDLTQDVFIDLYEALPNFKYQSDLQFYSFVFTITKRKLAKHYAKVTPEKLNRANIEESTLSASLDNTDTNDAVFRALQTLDEETREIITLHHWSRYTFTEIASLLNLTESATRVRHHRALKSLSAILTQS